MNTPIKAYLGAAIHDGSKLHEGQALLRFSDGRADIVTLDTLPTDCPTHWFDGGYILPGFVDLQVNGGGGEMFNNDPSVQTLRQMAIAHIRNGTAAILPTLITDTPASVNAAITAVETAMAEGVPGIIGLHLEGPHLSLSRKGAHEGTLVRDLTPDDMRVLRDAADRIANVKVTVAPESVSNAQISELSNAGIAVSLGHTDASYESCMAAFDAGARSVTHLFNAMSQLRNREPGLVGAALDHDAVYAGLIADGIHVHPAAIRAALAAKRDPSRIFLVSDAMAAAGSDITEFTLNDRSIYRSGGRLTLKDGTLAGADLDMTRAIAVLVQDAGQTPEQAITRATKTPLALLRDDFGHGVFRNKIDHLIHMSGDFDSPVWLHDLQ